MLLIFVGSLILFTAHFLTGRMILFFGVVVILPLRLLLILFFNQFLTFFRFLVVLFFERMVLWGRKLLGCLFFFLIRFFLNQLRDHRVVFSAQDLRDYWLGLAAIDGFVVF